jgi:hypothetical protein
MLSYLVCHKCWKTNVRNRPPPIQEIVEVNKDGTGSTIWFCCMPPNADRWVTEKEDIPQDCLCMFEQAVYSGSVNIDKKGGNAQ